MAEMDNPTEGPLWQQMMEDQPGIKTVIGFNSLRGTNTMMRGGFMDITEGAGNGLLGKSNYIKNRRIKNFRIFDKTGERSAIHPRQFIGGSRKGLMTEEELASGARRSTLLARRAERMARAGIELEKEGKAAKKVGYLRSARLNHVTANPRSFFRFHSSTVFTEGAYSPYHAAHFLNGKTAQRLMGKKITGEAAAAGSPEKVLFGAGLTSAISAGVRADRYGLKSTKLATMGTNLERIGKANGMSETFIKNALAKGEVGVHGNLLASSLVGERTRHMAGYMRGALGKAEAGGLAREATTGAMTAVEHMEASLAKTGLEKFGAKEVLEKGAFKTLGTEGVLKTLATKEGFKVLGARGLALAIPGLQVLAAASMAYDIGKIGGHLITGGIHLAKDAVKSMKGDIGKQAFGMGYKDTEAAATSRSRGVMAIQNSQLNARSVLGNEGALMAAHFG